MLAPAAVPPGCLVDRTSSSRVNLPFEIRIGLRYMRAGRRARRRNGFISFISGVSMAGIALGVATLIVVLSVMNGFEREVRDRMLSVLSHIEILSPGEALPDWRSVAKQAQAASREVVAAAPFVGAQALLLRGDDVRGVVVRGILPELEPKVAEAVAQVKGAKLTDLVDGGLRVVIGVELARALSLQPGDRISLVTSGAAQAAAPIAPRQRQFEVVGTFDSGHFEFDSTLVMMHIADAQRLFGVDGATGVRLRLEDMQRAPRVAFELSRQLDPNLIVSDWSRRNRTWFAAVRSQKQLMFIILAAIVAVAAFNLVATLVMTVTEKQPDIAILRTLGASPRSVMTVFIVQGWMIGLVGTLAGVAAGLLLANQIDVLVPAIERAFGVHFLDHSIYFISGLPSEPRASDVVPIGLISLVLALVATLYPSWRAARTQPAAALRYD
jgi:lipoprotein-releasing system permease protein